MRQVRDGDVAALGALYDKYRLLVFHTALAITRDRGAAEDVLRQCFLRLNTEAAQLEGEASIAPWLYRVTVDLSCARLARETNFWAPLETLLDRFDRLVAPARPFAQPDLQTSVLREIDTLPFNQRAVVILYYLGGLRLKEIAYILDCPIGTVKSRLHYGRELLRAQLTGATPHPRSADDPSRARRAPPILEVARDFAA
jgi:RNA polymerase sigma-70 factor (ECF subfamily)